MAKFEDGSYPSVAGKNLIAKVLAGKCKMEYVKATIGSGSIPEGMTPKTMTEVAGYVMDGKISSVTNPVDGECQVTVQVNSADVERGFYATGVLLYANDPDEGPIPYTYLVLETEPERIRPASSAVAKLATFDLIAAVDEIEQVFATIDPEAIVTLRTVQQLIREAIKTEDITIPTEGWAQPERDSGGDDEDVSSGSPGEPDLDNYGLQVDIPVLGMKEDDVPMVNIVPAHLAQAQECGLCATCKSVEGAVRMFAKQAPSSEIKGSLTVLGVPAAAPVEISMRRSLRKE